MRYLALTAAPEKQRALHRRLTYISLLMAYLSFLAGLAYLHSISEFAWSTAVWEAEDANPVVRRAWPLVAACLRDALLFVPLGFLVACGIGVVAGKRGFLRFCLALALATVTAWLLAMLVRSGWNGLPARRPSLPGIAFVTFVTFIGCWGGATWFYARSVKSWVLFQVMVFVMCVAGMGAATYAFALQSGPMVFEAEPIGTQDRRRFVKLFTAHDPRVMAGGEIDELTLTERDINQLLTWGLALGPDGQKARVGIQEDEVQFRLSAPLPRLQRHLNVSAAGMAFVNDGELAVKPRSLRIGQLTIPRWMLVASGPSIINRAFQNRHTRPFLTSLKNVELSAGAATVTYGPLALTKDLLSDALVVLGGDDMEPATAAHVEHLIAFAEARRSSEFSDYLQSAFDWAKKRTGTGADPVHENRAALLALGYLLGHDRVRSLVGPGLPEPSREVWETFNKVKLRERNDWVRHFTLSAVLELFSNPATSHMLGLLKEELDADGGSGFSFADLMADHAGTVLAQQVTRSSKRAVRLQHRLAQGAAVDSYFPPADLPEGLSDRELQRRYGGVGGEGYEQLWAEIESRVAAAALYE